MKINLFLLTGLMVVVGVRAQNVDFLSAEKLRLPEGKAYYHPLLSPSGEKIALTSSNQKGLVVYDFSEDRFQSISDKAGAGSKVVFSPDEARLYFTENDYVQKRRKSTLMYYDFSSGEKSEVKEGKKSEPKKTSWWERLIAWWNGTPSGREEELNIDALKNGHYDYPYVLSKGQKLIFKDVGVEREIQPVESANYLWGSLSPDGQKIVAVATSKGAFVCDVHGNNVNVFGEIEAPVWLTNDMVIGMVTKDDGHVITDYFLRIIRISDGATYTPENSPKIMQPSVSKEGKLIAGHTDEGEIVLIKYQINDQ